MRRYVIQTLVAILLILSTVLITLSCGDPYPPVKSTEEEARTVMTLTHAGETYDVKYELYRAFLIPLRDEMAKGLSDPWSGEAGEARRGALLEAVDARVLEIYTTFALCRELKIDLYDKKTEQAIDEYIRLDIEGDGSYEGYGSYDAYLAALKEQYLNYATAELLLRYSLGLEALYTHYIGTYDYISATYRDSALTVTDADVDAFYAAEDTARVMLIELPLGVYTDEEITLTHETLSRLLAEEGEAAMTAWLLRHTAIAESVTRGEILSPYTLDPLFYGEVTSTALALSEGSLSDPITVRSDELNSVYLIYRMDKPASYLEDNRHTVDETYRYHLVGRELDRVRRSLEDSMTVTDLLRSLDVTAVTMR